MMHLFQKLTATSAGYDDEPLCFGKCRSDVAVSSASVLESGPYAISLLGFSSCPAARAPEEGYGTEPAARRGA